MPDPKKSAKGREDILRCAAQIFATKGYAGTSTAAVARAAGVTQPLIHHHFSSKEGLWHAVLERIFSDMDAAQAEAMMLTADAPFLERIRAMIRAFIQFSAEHPELSRIMIIESAEAGPIFDHLYNNYVSVRLEVIRGLLDQAAELGLLRTIDRDFLPALIIGSCVHPFIAPETIRAFTGKNPSDPEMVNRYADLVNDLLATAVLDTSAVDKL